jgi:hypothetical protein
MVRVLRQLKLAALLHVCDAKVTSLEEEKLMWVLIFIFVSGSASYVEFTSEKQCNNAQDQISQVKGKLHYEDSPKFIMVCVPK